MIITCKRQIPFRWILFAVLPWMALGLNTSVMSIGFLFSLKKFVDNPAGLTFILSLPGIVSIFLVPIGNFLSDRIWTRFGRRKPFVGTGFTGIVLCMALMPLMPNFWALLAVYAAYGFFNDVGGSAGPMDPLNQEIVPPHQRGRASGTTQWCGNLVNMSFYFLALGRFDDVRFMAGVPLTGEKVIYWLAGILTAIALMFVMLGIKETDPKSELLGQRLSPRTLFAGLLDRELWPVFLLVFGSAMLNAGLGPLGSLLYTEQWGYSKQDMGTNVVVGSTMNIFIIGFLALIADRLNRMRAYQVLICTALALKVSFYLYVEYVLVDARPSLVEMIVFGECLSMVAILTNMIYGPLVYDYVSRNKMGTYMAGASLVTRVTQLLTLNGVGLFLWGYAALFQPQAGDMVRVSLRQDDVPKSEVAAMVRDATWAYPENGGPVPTFGVSVNAWTGTGVKAGSGRCWEIRLADTRSEEIEDEAVKLHKESSPLVTQEGMLRDRVIVLRDQKRSEDAAAEEKKADVLKARITELDGRARQLEATLAARSEELQKQAAHAFGDRILADGEQVLGAQWRDALVLELPTAKVPEGSSFERILADLRSQRPDVIDMRPVKQKTGYGVAVSMLLPSGSDEKKAAGDLQSAIERIAAKRDPKFFMPDAVAVSRGRQPALEMNLMTIEQPLDLDISPITRVVNFVTGLFGGAPSPDHRLVAMGRNLRVVGETDHVRVYPGANDEKTLSVVALMSPTAAKAVSVDDAVGSRLKSLLGNGKGDVAQARALYDRIELAASSQRLTVARPFVTVAYAPLKYDYMSGYFWMFLMGLGGISITVAFKRAEARGLIHKRGVEEAEGMARDHHLWQETVANQGEGESSPRGYFVPGYAPQKLAMALFGIALFTFGISQAWLPLKLAFVGGRAIAEATEVVKAKHGLPDLVLTSDAGIRAKLETGDRSYFFWNEFAYKTADDQSVAVRAPVGSVLKPLYPLVDENGLPTHLPVWYDLQHPDAVVFPTLFSTWFAPGALAFLGMICTVTGLVLFYWARRPIELPHIAATLAAHSS